MRNWFRRYFTPPDFGDEESNRRARLFNVILLTATGITFVYLLTLPLTNPNPLPGMAFLTAILLMFFGMFYLMRRGYLNAPIIALITIIWLVDAVASHFFGGVASPSYYSQVLIVFCAALLLSTRAAAVFAGLTILHGILLAALEGAGALPEPLSPVTPASLVGGLAVNFILIVVFLALENRSIQEALARARQKETEAGEKNRELLATQATLEDRVAERTMELERRNRYLQASAQVARQANSELEPQVLMDRAVELINELFGFYQVGVFLVDEKNEWAYLKAASSVGGKFMIQRGHRLQVGRQGIVGFVTSLGQPRIAQNIELDRIHAVAPELPETRSEMALPLKAGGTILGALDIQDKRENAFTQEDVQVFGTLADQVALAINNARLYQESQQRFEETRRAYGDISRESWLEAQRRGLLRSYRYAEGEAEALPGQVSITPSGPNTQKLAIQVRGQTIGSIDIVKDNPEQAWSENEVELLGSLTEQLGVALDSARLFHETQRRATNERVIGEITAQIRESLDIDTILRTAADEIRRAMNLPQVTVRLASRPSEAGPTNGQNSG